MRRPPLCCWSGDKRVPDYARGHILPMEQSPDHSRIQEVCQGNGQVTLQQTQGSARLPKPRAR